jgi:hypothetical protein
MSSLQIRLSTPLVIITKPATLQFKSVHCAATDWPIPLAFKFSVVAFTSTAIVADGGAARLVIDDRSDRNLTAYFHDLLARQAEIVGDVCRVPAHGGE